MLQKWSCTTRNEVVFTALSFHLPAIATSRAYDNYKVLWKTKSECDH